ncbi:MAG TPA: transglycosylase SLT domain-containing protein [Gemmatimonadaceae bacterium]|nr:transglycosylase SLT domain-containing protein [Gemmatimonadaceae bacterium]
MRKETRYVHRGDLERRQAKVRRWRMLLTSGAIGAVVLLLGAQIFQERAATASTFSFGLPGESRRLRAELDAARGELQLAQAQLDRANQILSYSSRYRISADVAASIYDIALAEGIEPDLAFRLVRVESQFNEKATSPVGAIGLTQLMPATAGYFQKGITKKQLYDRETNLRIGFRYLRTLINEHEGNLKLALLVYNRGPAAVERARAAGLDPANGYDRMVAGGYRGSGVVD